MTAPERIWAQDADPSERNFIGGGWWDDDIGSAKPPHTVEYVRADRIEELKAKLAKAVDALLWCSGSADFNEGGVAREGWLKMCAPLLRGDDHE